VTCALTIAAANWWLCHVGMVCQPAGACLIPVAPGLMAPSGVIMAGAALVLRDLVQRRLGVAASSLAILAGAVLSALLAPPALVLASAAAFLLSELADLAVFTPLVRRGLIVAVGASGVVGIVEIAAVFLWCCCRSRAWAGSAGATRGSASRRFEAGHGALRKRCAHEYGPLRYAAGDHHRDHHHHTVEEGHSALLDEWAAAARLRRRTHCGSCFHAALRAGARGSRDAGKLGQAGFHGRHQKGVASGIQTPTRSMGSPGGAAAILTLRMISATSRPLGPTVSARQGGRAPPGAGLVRGHCGAGLRQ
jgi:hypothetical protein